MRRAFKKPAPRYPRSWADVCHRALQMSADLPFHVRTRIVRALDEIDRVDGVALANRRLREPPYLDVFPDSHPNSPNWKDRPGAA